ncbi:cytochrome P450 9e2 [Asbolus verrucosus]|uniref:Cytochrome P450 9e2 n=1 Tax=Asbolus verrucosus TaxID=1661398 RepID=A0A482W4H6_ASBVE|nr:cytochrome P450 9e2 [Asbolus verrucosus]
MRAMYILMDECARQLVDYFKGQSKNLIEVELKDVFARYTNDVIASTAFGIKCDSLKQRNNEFLLAGRELIDVSGLKRFKFMLYGNFPVLTKLLNLKIVNTKVSNFFRSLINETLALREEKNIVRPDLIHMLMMARQGKLKYEDYTDIPEAGFAAVQESATGIGGKNITFLTNEDITAQAVVFFLGGFDTSSSLMCFAGYELAVNPHIQTRLKEEIIQTFHKSDGKISYEHLLSMKYLDMVLSEALRKWTQAIWIDRKCTKDFEIESEKEGEPTLKIKVGDVCWLPIFGIHWDPKYYPNPEIFDPERFSEENKEKIKSTTYLPFGIGPRNCIGSRFALLETKILFYYLLLDFDFVPVEKTQIPIKLKKDSAFLLAEKAVFFLAGFDTSSYVTDFANHEIAINPHT